jgi:hypothetical protein
MDVKRNTHGEYLQPKGSLLHDKEGQDTLDDSSSCLHDLDRNSSGDHKREAIKMSQCTHLQLQPEMS